MKNCLNCKFEPEWSEPTKTEYPRRHGRCQWDGAIPVLPRTHQIVKQPIVVYGDNSGVVTHCKTWEAKRYAVSEFERINDLTERKPINRRNKP